jgi:hypothetical protein
MESIPLSAKSYYIFSGPDKYRVDEAETESDDDIETESPESVVKFLETVNVQQKTVVDSKEQKSSNKWCEYLDFSDELLNYNTWQAVGLSFVDSVSFDTFLKRINNSFCARKNRKFLLAREVMDEWTIYTYSRK